MRAPIGVLPLALVAAICIGPAASASSVRSCKGTLFAGDSHFTTDPDQGVASAENLTTRGVSCSTAKKFVVAYIRAREPKRFRGYTCRTRAEGEEFADTRCIKEYQVIRWQSGA